MGESLLLITIITLVVLTIRRAKPVILENPVIIQRPGQYHITLAPQLNRAQTFIEQIARQYAQLHAQRSDLSGQYFEVHDPKVFPKDESYYLLAVAVRGGVMYFQAINPQTLPDDASNQYKNLRQFFEAMLEQHPLSLPELGDKQVRQELCGVVDTIAEQMKIAVKILHETD